MFWLTNFGVSNEEMESKIGIYTKKKIEQDIPVQKILTFG